MSLRFNGRDDRQLSLEVWEMIIDLVADDFIYLTDSARHDVVACCLVCRVFVPRCRFRLYHDFILWSRTQLDHVVHTLSNSPILCARLRELTIDAGNGADQSWVSTVPFRLPLLVSSLNELSLRGVDLSVMHP